MNWKNFILSSLGGGIIYWLLAGLFYGKIFPDIYPKNENTNMTFITLGCFIFAFFIGYIYNRWAKFTNWIEGLKAGAILGLLYGVAMNFFMYSGMPLNEGNFAKDVITNIICTGGLGATIAFINGFLSKDNV